MRSILNAAKDHRNPPRSSRSIQMLVLLIAVLLVHPFAARAETPAVGAKAPDFTLSTPLGHPVRMSQMLGSGPLVLIILRGYPGYQCPFCQRQVHDYIVHAPQFAALKAKVLLVYPGPPTRLTEYARQFLASESTLPANLTLVTDPNYTVTNLYSLRWDAPNETAYPSTFVLNRHGRIEFEKISHSHGDRLAAADAVAQVQKIR